MDVLHTEINGFNAIPQKLEKKTRKKPKINQKKKKKIVKNIQKARCYLT